MINLGTDTAAILIGVWKMLILNSLLLPLPGKLSVMPSGSSSGMDSTKFLAQAMQDSLAEIETCELALQKTSNDDIKAFSQHMIDQHSQMGREIEQLAGKKNATLPKDVSSEQKSTFEELSKLSGEEFDKKFLDHNVKDHEKDIRIFREQAEQANDSDIKAFAEKGVQQLSQHLNMAKEVERKLQS
jgi:putative membrane protein